MIEHTTGCVPGQKLLLLRKVAHYLKRNVLGQVSSPVRTESYKVTSPNKKESQYIIIERKMYTVYFR